MKQKTLNTTVSESKHTPGKWKVNHHKDVIHVENKYFIVCEIEKPASRINDPLNDEVNANARLIAAAPDMLEALKKANAIILEMGAIIRRIDDDNDHSDFWTLDGEYVPGCEFIQAAIAKATNNS